MVVLWFTGYPCSGKTTLATEFAKVYGGNVKILDGDELRKTLSKDLGFSLEDRKKHNERVIQLIKRIKDDFDVVIVCLVSPLRSVREKAKKEIGEDFFEVFLSCPLSICIMRDVKGHYKKALAGEISDFTGIHQPYEEPLNPDLIIYSSIESLEKSVSKLIDFIEGKR